MSHATWRNPPDPTLELPIEAVRYELDRFAASVVFSPEVLHHIKSSTLVREATRETVVRLTGVVAVWRADRILKVPANWWQHFKQRWFPGWALKRWPVLCEWYDAGVVLPRVPVVNPAYHMVEFPVWRKRGSVVSDGEGRAP